VLLAWACAAPRSEPLPGAVELVLLHTADTHSQLFPWRFRIGSADARRGLGGVHEVAEVGGFARLATLLTEERARNERTLHLDSGDLFQGSLAFRRYGGEPELLAFDALGVDAQVLGNHELDQGAALVTRRYAELATFPLLAANYVAETSAAAELPAAPGGLAGVIEPFTLLHAGGLRVGVIGVGNSASVGALGERPSTLGVRALPAAEAVQGAVDLLRPLVDVVVALTHVGLDADERWLRETTGVDVVLGGHQHLTLDQPEWVSDCAGGRVTDAWGHARACAPRRVPIVHSGAYGKYVGRITLALAAGAGVSEPLNRFEVSGVDFGLLPVHAGLAEDAAVARLLEPFRHEFAAAVGASPLDGFAPGAVERTGATNGDSPLGNFAADSMRAAAEADVALLGASSLRHDLPAGLIDAETFVRVLPFEDGIVRVTLTGSALLEVFERAARSAAARSCRTQVHVSGAVVRFRCPCEEAACAEVSVAGVPVDNARSYAVATTAYLAGGGSGLFEPILLGLQRPVADALSEVFAEALRHAPVCGDRIEAGCERGCPFAAMERGQSACAASGLGEACPSATRSCERVVGECRRLPCLDARAGAKRDGRIRFEAP
jgi:5'-nucleotidase/UDP-sugar diphosphatase